MTAADIIKRALRIAQVISQGDDPSGTDQETDAFTVLNSMIASWSAERLMIPYLVTDTLTLTIGDGEYTYGTGGDINSARAANLRFVQPDDLLVFLARLYGHDGYSYSGTSNFYFVGFFHVKRRIEFSNDELHDVSSNRDWNGIENNAHFIRFDIGSTLL